jgi:hypothetical protein
MGEAAREANATLAPLLRHPCANYCDPTLAAKLHGLTLHAPARLSCNISLRAAGRPSQILSTGAGITLDVVTLTIASFPALSLLPNQKR